MNRSKALALLVAVACALLLTGCPPPLIIGGGISNYGSMSLAPGFLPDPQQVQVVSGGPLNAAGLPLGPGCVGHVTRQPDYILHLTGVSPNLRFYVIAGGDITLLVNSATGLRNIRWASVSSRRMPSPRI